MSVNKYLKHSKLAFKNMANEEIEIYTYLKNNPVAFIPYEFTKKYKPENIIVYQDDAVNLRYVLYTEKRLYFPMDWTEKMIQDYYTILLKDMDSNSPHCYESAKFQVQYGDVVADMGTAEGIFALSIIEKARKVYLFECEERWLPILQKTFEPWKEKIIIINKFISDFTDVNCITIDDFLAGREINFIKADIEGAEVRLLNGAKSVLLTQNRLRLALCTYHRENDARELKQILTASGFETEYSHGYLIPYWEKTLTFRRGVIRAVKHT
jgi:hypothetical protein